MDKRVLGLMEDLNAEKKRHGEVEKELEDCHDYVIRQHDLGFAKVLEPSYLHLTHSIE